jgi:6,7-dimethyl-8-ribityllumazine synthase
MSAAGVSRINFSDLPPAGSFTIAIITSEWNTTITASLYEEAYNTLIKCGANSNHIYSCWVPGSFELTAAAAMLAETGNFDVIICLGCVIQGETRHFEFICNAVAKGLTDVSVRYSLPVIFGVLTTDNFQQARDRSGGTYGNKGIEAAVTAVKMAALRKNARSVK